MNSQEFEEKLQSKNFDLLEREFEKAKNYFIDLQDKITCDEAEQKFPVRCFDNKEMMIKFPIYTIRVIDNQIEYKDLEKLLLGKVSFSISHEENVFRCSGEKVPSIDIEFLENDLKTNKQIAKKIEEELIKKDIRFERRVALGDYYIPIEVDDEGYLSIK